MVTPPPQPDRLIDGYVSELDNAARPAPIVVGGVSIGAAVAADWALAHPGHAQSRYWPRCRRGPGSPESAPAALAAGTRRACCAATGWCRPPSQMRASSPPWLADELTRSWVGSMAVAARRHGGGVPIRRSDVQPNWRADRPDGRRRRDRRPSAPGRGRRSSGWPPRHARRCAPSRSTRWAPTRCARRGVRGRSARRLRPAEAIGISAQPPVMVRSCCIAEPCSLRRATGCVCGGCCCCG